MLNLPRERMLKRRSDFQRVYRSGRSYANRYMVLYVFEARDTYAHMAGKVGFAAGKKLGCAVVRNRVKRLLREIYRKNQHALRKDIAVLLVGRKAMVDARCEEAERTFSRLAEKADALQEDLQDWESWEN